jgi:hypothetical protein
VFNADLSLEGLKKAVTALKSWCNSYYGFTVLLCVCVHVLVMSIRAYHRSCGWTEGMAGEQSAAYEKAYPMCAEGAHRSGAEHTYESLSWIVWFLLAALPLLGVVWGVWLNGVDFKSYRRYMQFLRLEFDTKLGMHSPR